ncbi:MAG: hypothetical protein AAFO72_01105 [Pseudomonadota bacterium]
MDISAVEQRFYASLLPGAPQIKVALLIARAFKDLETPEDETINEALDKLIERSDIEAFGDVHHWRKSEIKRFD